MRCTTSWRYLPVREIRAGIHPPGAGFFFFFLVVVYYFLILNSQLFNKKKGITQKENKSGTTLLCRFPGCFIYFFFKKRTKDKLRNSCILVYTAVKMVLGGGIKYIQYIQTYLLYSTMTNYVHIKYYACI